MCCVGVVEMGEGDCIQDIEDKVYEVASVVSMKSVIALLSARTGEAYKPRFLLRRRVKRISR